MIDKYKGLMKRIDNNRSIIVLIILISVIFHYSIFISFPLSWDSAIYLDNAEYFIGNNYLYDEIRPPVAPLLIGIYFLVSNDLFILSLIWIAMRTAMYVVIYMLLFRLSKSRGVAFFTIMLLVFNPITLSIPLFMTEYLTILFIGLSLWYFHNYLDGRKGHIYLAFLLAGLAFLTRYYAIFLAGVYIIYFLIYRRKSLLEKRTWLAFLVGLMPVLIWMMWNQIVYQDFLFSIGRAFFHIQVDASSDPAYYYLFGQNYNLLNLLYIFIVPFAIGLYSAKKRKQYRTMALWFVLYLLSISFIQHKLSRYLFFLLIPMYFFAIVGTRDIMKTHTKKPAAFAPVIVFLLLLPAVFGPVDFNEQFGKGYEEIGLYLQKNTPADAIVVASPSPQVAYYGRRRTYSLFGEICKYLICPYYPYSYNRTYGCIQADYLVVQYKQDLPCIDEVYHDDYFYVYTYKGMDYLQP
jgi:4-amino-4-deoxy-L-arabinose transferase-like glycosyltransferase